MEITRRRLASIISFLASSDDALAFAHLLVDRLQFVERNHGLGLKVDQLGLQLLNGGHVAARARRCRAGQPPLRPRPSARFSALGGNCSMKCSCGMPHLSTAILRISRSWRRTSSTCERSMPHSLSIVLTVKRMRHQLVAERMLRLAIGGRAVAALLEGLAQLVEARCASTRTRSSAATFISSSRRVIALLPPLPSSSSSSSKESTSSSAT